jgi:hypothetical protein
LPQTKNNKQEIACCHQRREHIFLFFTSYRAAKKVKMIIDHQHEISDRKKTIMPYLDIGTLVGLWPWAKS